MIVALLLIAAVISVPLVNEHYFHIRNLSELRREAGNRFSEIQGLQANGDAKTAQDSIRALIEYFGKNTDDISLTATQIGMFQLASTIKQSAVSANQFETAIYEFEKLLKKFPNTPVAEQVLQQIADCYIALGNMEIEPQRNYPKAIQNLEKIEQNRPEAQNFPKYRQMELKPGKYYNLDRGRAVVIHRDIFKKVYTRKDLIREMATDTTQVKAEYLSDAVMKIGDCLTKMGQGNRAREQYRIIIDFFKESDLVDDAQKSIGEAYEKEADVLKTKAENAGDEAQKKASLDTVRVLYENAAETYLKFINVYVQSDLISKVYIELGGVYFKLGKVKEAYATFAKAINSVKVIEDQARVQLDIGTYYFNEKMWDDAIENYAKVLQNYSTTEFAANAQFLLAQSYDSKGDTLTAITAYNEVCENFRTSTFYPVSALKIGLYHIRLKDYVKAQKYLRQSINRFPGSFVAAQTQFELGSIYMAMAEGAKDTAEAVTKYRLAIKEFETLIAEYDQAGEWVEKAILEMGKCYMKLNLKEKARETLDNLTNQSNMVEKFHILGVSGSDSAIIQDYQGQLAKLTDDQAKAQVWLEIGKKLMGDDLNLVDSAITVFTSAIKLASDTVTLMTLYGEIGNAYMKKGSYKQARAIFTDEILNNPRCEEPRAIQFSFKVAESYFRDRQYKEAVEKFSEFHAKNPSHALTPAALYILGKSHAQLGGYKDARDTYDKIFAQFPKSEMVENAALGFAEALAGEAKYNDAITYIAKFLKNNPGVASMPSFIFKEAEIYRDNLEKPDSAIIFYEKALNFPDHFLFSASAYQLGKLYAAKGEDAKAIDVYGKVKKDNIEYFRAAQGEIGSLKAKTDPEGAIQNYEKIEASSPDVADKVIARMGIGDVYLAQKKYDQAVESYRVIYERYVDAGADLRSASLVKIIDALNNQNKYAEVISWADKMIRDFPDNRYTVNAVYFKGNAFYSLKKYREARETFKGVTERDTGMLSVVSQYLRAECLLSLGDQSGAIKEFNAFMEKNPQSDFVANAIFQISNIAWGKEDYPNAKKGYIRIMGQYPAFSALCWVKNYLAFCYNKENSWRKAKELFTEVRGSGCDNEAKQFAKEQIQAINVQH
ncbi:MAG: tetratricopeptide repeat protein [Fibrobacterota bacterium]